MSRVAVRIHGVMGDAILANRFIRPILDENKVTKVDAFITTSGKGFYNADVLQFFWPNFYNKIERVELKNNNEFYANNLYGGLENYVGHIKNLPESILEEIKTYDKFYDLNTDTMSWIDAGFNWRNYFYTFPLPQVGEPKPKFDIPSSYIVIHPFREIIDERCFSMDKLKKVIERLPQKYKIIIISSPKYLKDLNPISSDRVIIADANFFETFYIIKNCAGFIGIDSGWKCVAWMYGKPMLTLVSCPSNFNPIPSFRVRWQIFEESCLPTSASAIDIVNTINNFMDNQLSWFYPGVPDINRFLLKRF